MCCVFIFSTVYLCVVYLGQILSADRDPVPCRSQGTACLEFNINRPSKSNGQLQINSHPKRRFRNKLEGKVFVGVGPCSLATPADAPIEERKGRCAAAATGKYAAPSGRAEKCMRWKGRRPRRPAGRRTVIAGRDIDRAAGEDASGREEDNASNVLMNSGST
jgi:hypothetical protein